MTPIQYLQDTHQISPGHPPNISRKPIKYLQDTEQKYLQETIKYLQHIDQISRDTDQISLGNRPNISLTLNKYP